MRAWFHLVGRQRSSELFMLNVLLVTLGLATLTEAAGLSLALGAFLAGMLIAETEYRMQVEEDIKPFRDVLLGLFFVTVGMGLDLELVLEQWPFVLLLLGVPVAFKLALIVALARVFGAPLSSSMRTGFYLAQAGELALVMLALGTEVRLLQPALVQVVLASMVLSMLAAPLVIQFAEPIVRKLTANDWLARATQITAIASTSLARQEHVLVCGYGRSGQNLARLLEREKIAFVALDNDSQRVREAAAEGSSVVFGDAGRREALIAAGVLKASAVVVTFADTLRRPAHPRARAGAAARSAGHRAHRRRRRPRPAGQGRRDRSGARGAGGQPDARLARAARARRAAQPGAGAHPRDPGGALQPVPRLLPRARPTPPTARRTCSRGCIRCCSASARLRSAGRSPSSASPAGSR